MLKIIEYSEILSKLNKKVHLPVKNIDTVILDTDRMYDLDEAKYAKDLNNIVISKDKENSCFPKFNCPSVRTVLSMLDI